MATLTLSFCFCYYAPPRPRNARTPRGPPRRPPPIMPAMPPPPMAAETGFPRRPPRPPAPAPRPTPLASAAPGCSERGLRTVSSMERITQAASDAAANEFILFAAGSQTPLSKVSVMPSTSTSTPYHLPAVPLACFMRSWLSTSVASKPALSESCRGMTSRARAMPFMISCSLPSMERACSRTNLDTSISMAPPPATTSPERMARFTMQSASWTERCVSSMNCSEPPRSTMVAVRDRGQPVKRL
mmetsp:Transcript_37367/g.116831  ORF Transcript_37367/g.116831 Transcript_37367/m.116831 type:complete len:244 (-) Transcript_37367:1164-1895(-)